MKCHRILLSLALCLTLVPLNFAQTSAQPASALPRLVRFAGTAKDASGATKTGVVGITFALYSEQTGGAPLWLETQNVMADSGGHYVALLGSTKPDGLPADIFTSEQARWVGIQVSGQAEQPRVLLVSAPYALKAGDAETVGGLPPSAFMLAAPYNGSAAASNSSANAAGGALPPSATDVTTTGGTADYLPIFNGASTVIDSVLYQTGSGNTAKIGINTTTPAATLDVAGGATIRGLLNLPAAATATATAGADSRPFGLVASAYNSGSAASTNQVFHWQAEPVGNNTTSPSATLNLLFAVAPANATETGLKINSSGQITFATGQTFPGTGSGTITGITTASGSGLTGGGTSGTLSLSVPAGGITNAMLTNPSFTISTNNGLTGGSGVTLGSSITLGIAANGCSAGNALTALPFSCSAVATPGANTFTGNQTLNGDLLLPNTTSGGAQGMIEFGGVPFIHNWGPSGSFNAFFGRIAGNLTNTGFFLTAVGDYALSSDTSGSDNTAFGYNAGVGNTTGSSNTFLGFNTTPGSASLTNATAIGANAVVSESNALVLGGTGANAVSVGVGTATPAYTLDVHGTGNFSTGVSGESATVGANGVYGSNSATSGVGTNGVYGSTSSPAGGGVIGVNFSSGGNGVYGQTNGTSATAAGVYGTAVSSSTTVSTYGVYGTSSSSEGGSAGVYGVNSSSSVNTTYGVYGVNSNSLDHGTAVAGTSSTISATGSSQSSLGKLGVWGDNVGSIAGVLGTADVGIAMIAENSTGTNTDLPTLYVTNESTDSGNPGALALQAGGGAGNCTIDVNGNLLCEGSIKTGAKISGGPEVELYGVASPEHWFEDFGSGAITGGRAVVSLDPAFAATVNTAESYHVFLTPNGDCKGLYVANKTAGGFEVRELGGGTSSVSFDYRIVAKRRGYESVRLQDITGQANKLRQRQAEMLPKGRGETTSAPPRPEPMQVTPRTMERAKTSHSLGAEQ
jgi:hypothetical protein